MLPNAPECIDGGSCCLGDARDPAESRSFVVPPQDDIPAGPVRVLTALGEFLMAGRFRDFPEQMRAVAVSETLFSLLKSRQNGNWRS